MSLDNIFGTEENKKKSSTSTIKKVSTSGLDNIFANAPKVNMDYTPPVKEEVKKAPTFIDTALDKTATVVGKVATSVGNWLAEQNKQNEIASLGMRDIMQGKVKSVVDPVTGKKIISSQYSDAYKLAKTPEEQAKVLSDSQKDIPLIKFLNSETGQKVTGEIASKTSNVPLKIFARIKSLGDDTYDEAYSAALAKSKDPNNSRLEKILYGVQDSGVQSAIGALLAVGTSLLTKNANTGRAVSLPFFAAISAEGQRQEKGEVNSIGNIAIDTVGDTVLSGFAEGALKSFAKEGAEQTAKEFAKKLGTGFAIEGSTENAQTFLKYGNDYKNALTEEEKQKVVKSLTEYVKSGAMVDEFLIGGLAGAGITGVASGIGSQMQNKGEISPEMTTEETKKARQAVGELNVDFSELRDELLSYQKEADYNENVVNRVDILQDQLNDFQQAFKDRAVYISNENQTTPLATIETIKYPDGKYAFSFSADTQQNSLISPFDNSKLFKTKEEAIKEAKKNVLDWLDNQAVSADSTEMQKIDEIRTEIENVGVTENDKRIADLKNQKDMVLQNQEFNKMGLDQQLEYLTLKVSEQDIKEVYNFLGKGGDYAGDSKEAKRVMGILEDMGGIGREADYAEETIDKITSYFNARDRVRVAGKETKENVQNINKKIRQIKNGEWLVDFVKQFNSARAFADQFGGISSKSARMFEVLSKKIDEATKTKPKTAFGNEEISTEKYADDVRDLAIKFKRLSKFSQEQAIKRSENDPERGQKDAKGIAMADSAILRKLREEPTKTEISDTLEYLQSNFVGKRVTVDGKPAKVVGNVFGNVKVQFTDGMKKNIFKENITSPKATEQDAIRFLKEEAKKQAEGQIEIRTAPPEVKEVEVAGKTFPTEESIAKEFPEWTEYKKQEKIEQNNLKKLNDFVEDKTGKPSNLDPYRNREEIENIYKEITNNSKTFENKEDFTEKKNLANPKFEDYGIYSLDEQAQKYDEFIKPQLEKLGDVGTDETIIYYNGDGKNDQYVNTQLREVFTYPVDENLKVKKVKKTQLKTTGNEDKDAIGYRLLKEEKINTEPVIENRNKREVEKQPVVTEGKVKNSRAFQRVQERLGEYADFDVNYNKLNLAKDTAKALEFIEKNPVDAKKIALGMQIAPEGVTETAISIALAEKASENKDYALQAQLERSRSLRQTRRGQEIVAERGRFNENSSHFFMQQVLKARIEQAGKVSFTSLFRRSKLEKPTGFESQIKEGTDNIKKTVKKKLSATDLAQSVIDSLTC